jgi:hypothetical protein
MSHAWWKKYFFFALALFLAQLGLMVFFEEAWRTTGWDWAYVPIAAAELAGLLGFAWRRRLGRPELWQIVFLASLAYEAAGWFSLATDPDLKAGAHESFIMLALLADWIVRLPMLIALFLYGFRSKALWQPGTPAPS